MNFDPQTDGGGVPPDVPVCASSGFTVVAAGVANGPYFAIGHLDGDGLPDLAALTAASDSLRLFLGVGDGTFRMTATIGLADNLQTLAMTDVTRDGVQDIVLLGLSGVFVFSGRGDGTVDAPITSSTCATPGSVVVAALDADENLDIAATCSDTNDVSVGRGNGDGTFAAAMAFETGGYPNDVAAADFDRDGAIDLATANVVANTISVLRSTGNGSFLPNVDYAAANSPYQIAAADLDRDGYPELGVARSATGRTVSIWRNLGDGTFAPRVDYSHGPGITFAFGDLDGDGDIDVVAADQEDMTASLFMNNGDGTFAAPTILDASFSVRTVATSDVNRDGALDIVGTDFASGDLYVFLGQCI